jgi:chlorite dismutase
LEAGVADAASCFFSRWAEAAAPFRARLEIRDVLWGFTRQSQYTKTKSQQELDPFAAERQPYLIVYPFVKTADWYLKSQDERREMMMGHIKVGKQYKDITQLLLYSFGLQDQEFVVVYETHDLTRFMELVNELRKTEARRYTERDWPLHAGVHQPDLEALAKWL